ncbi:MAG: beta-propeller fold lactonase family protein [Caldilineaceae bacterium]
MQQPKFNLRPVSVATFGTLFLALALGIGSTLWAQEDSSQTLDAPLAFDQPTYSSPLALDANKNLLWVVNPDDDKVTVIGNLDSSPSVVKQFSVGDEPQSIAIDTDASPNSYNVYVANPAGNSVTVIQVSNSSASSVLGTVEKTLITGSEPWDVVASPDGKRVFVANSGQDTISVIDTATRSVVTNFNIGDSQCNDPDRSRHFQPRGLAVTQDGSRLFVTRFLSFTKPGGKQADDLGKEGVVCQLNIPASVNQPLTFGSVVSLGALDTGFKIDKDKDGVPDATSAYPNQMQSIVIRGNQAYLPNIAASPSGPLKFNVDTQAFVNVIDNAGLGAPIDASASKGINTHLGARVPESGKKKLFFANPWAIAFTNQNGTGNAYVASSGSDLLVKLNVDASGKLDFTNGVSTTRYIDLNDPANPATQGRKAGKNPLGIVIRGSKAYVMNYISRNLSVVDLSSDSVTQVVETSALPFAGSQDEQLLVGKEVFFSSRGLFNGGKSERLSSEGWQNCASCHFAGLTDGNIWAFATGPRKSVPLNGTWSPHNPDDQRMLNYSAIFDEVQDFEINIRNVSGPGNISAGPPPVLDPNHGLIISDTGDINAAPAVVNAFVKPNAGRPQLTVALPGSNTAWPALDAMKEWVRFSVRTPNGLLTQNEMSGNTAANNGALNSTTINDGRKLFFQAGCQKCHGSSKWSSSFKDFVSPPAAADIATEVGITTAVQAQFLPRFLNDILSFGLGTPANPIGNNIGGTEVNEVGLLALGKDHNNDGKGNGFNPPSLLGIWHVQPYYHNGACESLACVLSDANHRAKGLNSGQSDPLSSAANQAKVVAFLQSLDADTKSPFDLRLYSHDIFVDPPVVNRGAQVVIGANVQLFGGRADLINVANELGLTAIPVRFETNSGLPAVDVDLPITAFKQDFGQATVTATWNVPTDAPTIVRITVSVDPENVIPEDREGNNEQSRRVRTRAVTGDTTPPVVTSLRISDDDPFNDNDPFVTTRNVKVKIVASDTAPGTVKDYCLVGYKYDAVNRRWVELSCTFTPLPAPENGTTDTFIVNKQIDPTQGVVYAFVWVRDNSGNISRTPAFDVVSFISGDPINLHRNDVLILRIPVPAGQNFTLKADVEYGNVDIAVFDDFTNPNAALCGFTDNSGDADETIALPGDCPASPGRLQVEISAIKNSRFTISLTPGTADEVASVAASNATEISADEPSTPLVAGPPALQTAIDEPQEGEGNVYLPLVVK